ARLPPHSFASSRISFESTSSVFCASPWTLLFPAEPKPSASAPLFTRVLIPLHARAIVSMSRRRSALMSCLSRWRATRNWLSVIRFMAALFYSPAREPGAAQEKRGEQPVHRPHAGDRGQGAGAERNERVAAVEERGAHAHRLALATGRRSLVEERHDHRLRAAQAEPEDEGERQEERHAREQGKQKIRRPGYPHRRAHHHPLAQALHHERHEEPHREGRQGEGRHDDADGRRREAEPGAIE